MDPIQDPTAVPEASEAMFGDLHTALTRTLIARIESGLATPADLSVARQLLKDNNVTSVGARKPIRKLAQILPFNDPAEDSGEHRINSASH